MKTLFTFFILFCSSALFAENYRCQYDYYGETRPVLLKRNLSYGTEYFDTCSIHFENCGNGSLDILEESIDSLYLGSTLVKGGYQITIIDKKNLMFRTVNLYEPTDTTQTSAVVEGKCLLEK